MKYYPVNLDIKSRNCLVIGGGPVGTRKVKTLIKCGALVTVVSLEFEKELEALAKTESVTLKNRTYHSSDMKNVFLVIGATSNRELNRQINADANRLNILCNIADVPEVCNFILPAIVKRGDLMIAISTSGNSPAFAKKIRKDLEKQFGHEYAEFLKLMGAIRKKLLSEAHEPEAHKHLFEKLIDNNLVKLIKDQKKDKINRLLQNTLGKEYKLEKLISKP